jgi:transposase
MNLTDYESITKTELSSRRYVSRNCRNLRHVVCPVCHSREFVSRADGRRLCRRCRYIYHDLSGRWINRGSLSAGQWLRIVKLFELELSTRKMAFQLGIAYNTAFKAIRTIRSSILAHAADAEYLMSGEVELDESYFGGKRKGKRGRGAAGKVPVFGILERDGLVNVSVVPDVTAATLLDLAVKKVRRGSIVYTDRYKSYDSLMFCGYRHLKVDHKTQFARGRVYINGLEGFWSFAKERLIKHHGVSPRHFPFYLKEMEFRYNHRTDDIFPIVVKYLCDYEIGIREDSALPAHISTPLRHE